MRKILAIDVGGTFTKYAVMVGADTFEIAEKNKIPTPKRDHEEFLAKLTEIFHGVDDAEGLAVSMPGLIDSVNGVCLASELLNFNNGHCVAEELQAMCGVPVTIENDANCAALAEVKSGNLVGVNDAFVLVFGTSVGGAFIRGGEIYRGAHHCAGEVSFTLRSLDAAVDEKNFCGNEISALALLKSCAEILDMPPEEVTGEMIFDLLAEGDDDMLDALKKFSRKVALKIFNLQVLFDPERFALGGAISEQESFIAAVRDELDALGEKMPAYLPRPEVVACKYHNDANLLGALYRYLREEV